MSNQIVVEAMRGILTPTLCGILIYDNYGTCWIPFDPEEYPLEVLKADWKETLKIAFEHHKVDAQSILDHVNERECGMKVNGKFYEYEEFAELYKEIVG